MKTHRTYLTPTLLTNQNRIEQLQRDARPNAERMAQVRLVADNSRRNLAAAYRAGVKIAFGTDSFDVGMARELALMVAAGMSPADAIKAATTGAANLIGASDRIGAVKPGLYADIVATEGDPLQDVTTLEHVTFVMKGGKVYLQDGHPVAAP